MNSHIIQHALLLPNLFIFPLFLTGGNVDGDAGRSELPSTNEAHHRRTRHICALVAVVTVTVVCSTLVVFFYFYPNICQWMYQSPCQLLGVCCIQ